jgi:hypothetical protein
MGPMPPLPAVIACLTDFGTQDAFVGITKGVIARTAPTARLLDLTHEIPSGDVRQASVRLWQAAPHMPKGTIFLAVVDPGVGTSRRAVALAWKQAWAVGPDNGVFTHMIDLFGTPQAVELNAPPEPRLRATFHGRDIFAPAAAALAAGASIGSLGHPIDDLALLPPERLEVLPSGGIQGEVLFADHFGNLITSIGVLEDTGSDLSLVPWVRAGRPTRVPRAGLAAVLPDGRSIPLRATFAEAPPGEPLAYIGSDGLLEVGVNQGRAADTLSIPPGTLIRLESRG